MPVTIDLERLIDLLSVRADEDVGICTQCGAETTGVEPDARGYECETCGAHAVCGAEELLLTADLRR